MWLGFPPLPLAIHHLCWEAAGSHVAVKYLFSQIKLYLNSSHLLSVHQHSDLVHTLHRSSAGWTAFPSSLLTSFHMSECTAPPPPPHHTTITTATTAAIYCHFPPSHSIIFHYIPSLTLWSRVPRSSSCQLKCHPCSPRVHYPSKNKTHSCWLRHFIVWMCLSMSSSPHFMHFVLDTVLCCIKTIMGMLSGHQIWFVPQRWDPRERGHTHTNTYTASTISGCCWTVGTFLCPCV